MKYLLPALLLIAGCAPNPYRETNKVYRQTARALAKQLRAEPAADSLQPPPQWVGTTNFNLRKPNIVVIHHTAQAACEKTLVTFTRPASQVSAHYVICKDGTVHHMLNDYLRAWHGGASKWGNMTDLNSGSIGIELDNDGYESFTETQITSLLRVLEKLKSQYGIPKANFIGHSDIAPGRKVDPNRKFPWQRLSENGYGMWYDTTGIVVPPDFNATYALRMVGYNTKDSASALYSFKLHFVQTDSSRAVTEDDKKILYDLIRKSN